jgi:hypothetical protein
MHGVIITIASFLSLFGIIYVFITARHRERMALIDRGVDASILTDKNYTSYPTLKFGMLFVGIALGILLGNMLDYYYDFTKGVAYLAMIFLLGGVSLILNFFIERRLSANRAE